MAVKYRFAHPDRFVVGVVSVAGEEAEPTYLLQIREAERLLTVSAESHQVEALAIHVARVLDEVGSMSMGMLDVGESYTQPIDAEPLDLPHSPLFPVGTMAIGWDAIAKALHLDLFSENDVRFIPEDGEVSGEEQALREAEASEHTVEITLLPQLGREFVAKAHSLLGVLSPPCPMCGQPVEPEGHICPRLNGYRGPEDWDASE